MLALSLWQPWAELVVSGRKRIENRRWPTKVRGQVLIHATHGVGTCREWNARARALWVDLPDPYLLPRGGLVGSVEIVDCVERSDDPWFVGPYGFVLANPKRVRFVELRGRQRFFRVPPEVEMGLFWLPPGAP